MPYLAASTHFRIITAMLIASVTPLPLCNNHFPLNICCNDSASLLRLQGSVAAMHQMYNDFIDAFGPMPNCTSGGAGDPYGAESHDAPLSLCSFHTAMFASGPFNTGNAAFFIPVEQLTKVIGWSIQRRASSSSIYPLDLLIHPNTGCEVGRVLRSLSHS
jgi:hypothetical protein